MPSRQKTLAAVGTGCTILALAAWAFYVIAFAGVRGDDWMVFYTAGRTAVEGKLAILYDGDKLTALLNARFAHWLRHPLILHPFLYPPHTLLLLAPFALLPPLVGGVLFLAMSFAGLAAALSLYATDREEAWLYGFAALLCPAAAIVVCAGQNTFVTLALLIGGLALSGRRPVAGGVLLGLMTFKPQLWLMVPVALVALRQWKALAVACVTGLALIGASIAAFGLEPWRDWIHVMTAPSHLYVRWNAETRVNGLSTYNYARFLGVPERAANLVQYAMALAAAGIVYWAHRRTMPRDLRLAVVLAATFLASPHMLLYDAMTVEIAAALFFAHALRNGTPLIDTIVAVAVWLVTLINPPTLLAAGEATPFLALLLIALIMRRGREAPDTALPSGALSPA